MRVVLNPKWHGLFENWARKWVRNHFWRVSKLFLDQEDAVGECCVIFYYCLRHYEGRFQNTAHFMALYKTTIFREWILLAKKDYAMRNIEELLPAPVEWEHSAGFMLAVLTGSSAEMQQMLVAIAEAPSEVLQMLFEHASINDMNKRVKRFFGIKGRKNVIRELRALREQ